jgi:hypothetical protein
MFKESHLSVCQVKRMAEQLCKDTAQRKGKGRKGRTNSPRVQDEIFFFLRRLQTQRNRQWAVNLLKYTEMSHTSKNYDYLTECDEHQPGQCENNCICFLGQP